MPRPGSKTPSRHEVLACDMRPHLERRASDLGVPFAASTETGELALLTSSEEQRDLRHLDVLPECFGLVWSAPPQKKDASADCVGCQIQMACLQKFAFTTLQDAAQACHSHSPGALGQYLSVSRRAVVFAQAFWHLLSGHVDDFDLASAEAQHRRNEAAPGDRLQNQTLPQATLEVVDSRQRLTDPLDAARKPPKSGTMAQRRARRMANSIRQELERAKRTDGHTRFVQAALHRKPRQRPSLGREDHEVCAVWDEKTYYARWFRERKRSPLLAQLRPGVILTRVYRGTCWTVKVHHGFYSVGGVKYPTLYTVVKTIVGAKRFLRPPNKDGVRPAGTRSMCNYSAVKFFEKEIRRRLEAF